MMDKNKQIILMLSTYFSSPKKGEPTCLTPLEYGRFALWLRENDYQPKDLFSLFDEILNKWKDKKNRITRERLNFLIGRGMAMGVALEKWNSAGIWVITRSDIEYPRKLKTHLGENAPAVLFGVGNKSLLNAGGLSVVGSRNIDTKDQEFTKCIAEQAAMEGLNIISGGARGVDETAMLASLKVNGASVGILSNGLLKAALSGIWRKYIKKNQLVLVSTFYPEASFNVGNAMGRNKYIYCLSDYALVVRSEEGKGGTWAGANENLKKQWIPLFVKKPSDAAGNIALKNMGASSLHRLNTQEIDSDGWLLDQLKNDNKSSDSIDSQTILEVSSDEKIKNRNADKEVDNKTSELISDNKVQPAPNFDRDDLFYQYFIHYIEYLLDKQSQITLAKLKELRKDLAQKQITDWLDRATDEELIIRQGKKRTYSKNKTDLFQMVSQDGHGSHEQHRANKLLNIDS